MTQTLSRGTTTTWSMSTSVLIDGTTQSVELRCNSVELSRDNRDSRLRIEHLLNNAPVDFDAVTSIAREISDIKENIYRSVLADNEHVLPQMTQYAARLEERLSEARKDALESTREALETIQDSIATYFAEQYGIDSSNQSVEYFVSDLSPDLLDNETTANPQHPFMYGDEAEEFLGIMVRRACSTLDLSPEYGDEAAMSAVLQEVPLPVYGSKPEALQSLWSFLGSKLPNGATIGVSGVFAHELHNPYLLLVGLTGSFLVWFVTPHMQMLREETAAAARDWTKKKLRGEETADG